MQVAFEEKINLINNKSISSGRDYVFHRYPSLYQFSILLEEWRVSIFAQHLKTTLPVSEKRIHKAWQKIEDEYQ